MTREEIFEEELAKRGIATIRRGRVEGKSIVAWEWDAPDLKAIEEALDATDARLSPSTETKE